MKVLVSGSSGLVGSALVRHLTSKNKLVKILVRRAPSNPSEISWNPMQKGPEPQALEGIDAVVHLAGDGIASGRWTASKKKTILESRSVGTRLLSEALAGMKTPPKVLISASAIGFYGDRGSEVLREESSMGSGFLSDVCQAWEQSTEPASRSGIRVVHMRMGIVLSPDGGALAKMLLPFKMGVGGKIGSGNQYMSWISLDDVIGTITYALFTDSLKGPVNTVAPNAVTNLNYTKTLGRVLNRPTFFPMPTPAARLVFGEMADALLLASTRVEPAVLQRSGYRFQYPDLEGAFRHLLKK
jgi:uncharacterized protein (TIGR01777 family)